MVFFIIIDKLSIVFINKELCEKFIIDENSNIKQVISKIENGGLKIALVINNKNKVIGTICDGDIRRGLLKGLNTKSSISSIITRNFIYSKSNYTKVNVIRLMKENGIYQVPILSDNYELLGLEIADELKPTSQYELLPNSALLMAGGRGERLRPLTDNCPKPLLPINGEPILEIILKQCISAGVNNFYISVHYLSEKIINYFGDGSKWGVQIKYLKEEIPLGTAGALKLIPDELDQPILIINGDILTKVNFRNIFNYHKINNSDITICAREYLIRCPFGVIEVKGNKFKSMIEKPTLNQLVNAGIYILDSKIINLIKKDLYLDMPDLITMAKGLEKNIIVYPVHEYWLDIGKPETLDRAVFEWENTY